MRLIAVSGEEDYLHAQEQPAYCVPNQPEYMLLMKRLGPRRFNHVDGQPYSLACSVAAFISVWRSALRACFSTACAALILDSSKAALQNIKTALQMTVGEQRSDVATQLHV